VADRGFENCLVATLLLLGRLWGIRRAYG